jgi:hypothetical protein
MSLAKHPALAHHRVRDSIETADADELERLDGWDGFSVDEKRVLGVLPWCSTGAAATQYLGIPNGITWMRDHQRRDPLFRAAVQQRRWSAVHMAKRMGAEMLSLATVQLSEILMSRDTPTNVLLDAIGLVFKINRVDREPTAPFIQTNHLIRFAGSD